MIWLLFFIGVAFIPAVIAKNKGASFGLWYLYGLCLFPIAFFHALLFKDIVSETVPAPRTPERFASDGWARSNPEARTPSMERQAKDRRVKKCPDCAEEVLADARVCRFCRHTFDVSSEEVELLSQLQPDKPHTGLGIDYKRCKGCNVPLRRYAMSCNTCGAVVEAASPKWGE